MTLFAQAPASRSRLIWIAIWALIAVGLAFAASSLSWSDVLNAALRADPLWLVIALLVNLANAPLWSMCWRCLVGRSLQAKPFGVVRVLAVVLAAIQAFSVLGGGATAFVLVTGRLGLSKMAAVSLLALDTLTTGLTKTLMVGAALAVLPGSALLRGIGAGLLAAAAVALGAFIAFSRSRERLYKMAARRNARVRVWIEHLGDMTSHLDVVRSPARLGGAVFFMFARRMCEGLAAWCVAVACGIPVGPEIILLAVAAIAISTLIPGPPGHVGLYELAVVGAYQWVGIAPETALAAALLQHALFLVSVLAPGALIIALDPGFAGRKPPPA